jgi:hypothetical protein
MYKDFCKDWQPVKPKKIGAVNPEEIFFSIFRGGRGGGMGGRGRGWERLGEVGGGGREDEKLGLQASLKSAYLMASSFFAIIFAHFFLQAFRASTPTTDRHL